MPTFTLPLGRRAALALAPFALVPIVSASSASADGPRINFGRAVMPRLENSTNYDGSTPEGQSKLVVNAQLDVDGETALVVVLEQGGRALATGSCAAEAEIRSGEAVPGRGALRECVTGHVLARNLRVDQPASVVIAVVDDATDERRELYRAAFPVVGYWDWKGNEDAGPVHVEHRGLRLDALFGVGYVQQTYSGTEVSFGYVETVGGEDFEDDSHLRCRVNGGEVRVYEGTAWSPLQQTLRNRVFVDGAVHEDGPETWVTRYVQYAARLPVVVQDSGLTAEAGSSMDGEWACELRFGQTGQRVTAREFRFRVAGGAIQSDVAAASVRAGQGAALVAIGIAGGAVPTQLDPALVRTHLAGLDLPSGTTAPVFAGLPERPVGSPLTAPRVAARAAGRRR